MSMLRTCRTVCFSILENSRTVRTLAPAKRLQPLPETRDKQNFDVSYYKENSKRFLESLEPVKKPYRERDSLKDNQMPRPAKKIPAPPKPAAPVDPPELVTEDNQYLLLKKATTPLWDLPYSTQLQKKRKANKEFIRKLTVEMRASKIVIGRFESGAFCPLDEIIPAPLTEFYRNKDEFGVKTGADGNSKTVGLFVRTVGEGYNFVCVRPTELTNTKPAHKLVASLFEKFIRQSPMDACLLFSDGGFWRGITVRSNKMGDLMAVVIAHPQDFSQEQIEDEKSKLVEYFRMGEGKEANLKSMYFQASRHTRASNEISPYQLLYGEPHLEETLLGKRFRISPDSFFQINSWAAESMYEYVMKMAELDEETTLLDLCCGTGAISLSMADYCKHTVGVDSSQQAIDDAIYNSVLNGVTNTEFHCAKLEDFIPEYIDRIGRNTVAVVNPGRNGMHKSAIQALRQCTKIKRLIYISCKPDGRCKDNFIDLCRPTSSRGKAHGLPYVPVVAVPVDLFPQTTHCELMIAFDRYHLL